MSARPVVVYAARGLLCPVRSLRELRVGVLAYAVVDAVLNSVSVTFEPAGDGGSLAFRVVAERREPGGVVHRAFGRGDLAELSRGRCDPAAVLAGAVADAVDAVAGSVAAD